MRTARACAALLSVVFCAAPARAQPVVSDAGGTRETADDGRAGGAGPTPGDPAPIDDAERERARSLVADAVAAYEAGEYQTALDRFRAAFAIAPLPQVRFNIARCLERLARPREAADEYEAVVDAPALSEDARAEARANLTRLRARLAQLLFDGQAGVRVRVDGADTCVSPCGLTVDPGRHVVEGVGPAPRNVELAEGEALRLEAVAATEPEAASGWSAGALSTVGAAVAGLGLAGVLGFGLQAQSLHEQFLVTPTESLASEGTLMRDLSHASIAILSAGAALILIDLVIDAAD